MRSLRPCILRQHAATHCNTRQHTATHGNTRQHTATVTGCAVSHRRWEHTTTHCKMLQHTLQHAIKHYHSFECAVTLRDPLQHTDMQHTATHYNTMPNAPQHIATVFECAVGQRRWGREHGNDFGLLVALYGSCVESPCRRYSARALWGRCVAVLHCDVAV